MGWPEVQGGKRERGGVDRMEAMGKERGKGKENL